jgi:hypothetical protein
MALTPEDKRKKQRNTGCLVALVVVLLPMLLLI